MTSRLILLTIASIVVPFLLTQSELLLGGSPQFAFTLAGSFLIHMATRPTKWEIPLTIVLGVALRLFYGATVSMEPSFVYEIISLGGFLGIASIIILVLTAPRKDDLTVLGSAIFFPFFSIVVGFMLPLTSRLSPVALDTHLLAVDGVLGFQPSFLLGSLIGEKRNTLQWNLIATLYYALPLPVALLCASHLNKGASGVRRLLFMFGTMSVCGFSIFALCPATGPYYAFREWFPLAPPVSDIPLIPLNVPYAPRNAIPSLHMSAALLVFWNTFGMRKLYRCAAGLFLAGTAFAVLALGEHYFIDIVVAVPFSLMFQTAFIDNDYIRWKSFLVLGCAVVVFGWLMMLRFNAQALVDWPVITTSCVMLTLGLSALVRYRPTEPADYYHLKEVPTNEN